MKTHATTRTTTEYTNQPITRNTKQNQLHNYSHSPKGEMGCPVTGSRSVS